MISPKGREEILSLLHSELVQDWAEMDKTLKNVVHMLLSLRPDLLRLYFLPAVWVEIMQMDRKSAGSTILAAIKAEVISANGAPEVINLDQARFYLGSRVPSYIKMARQWCLDHPDECPTHWLRDHPNMRKQLPSSKADSC